MHSGFFNFMAVKNSYPLHKVKLAVLCLLLSVTIQAQKDTASINALLMKSRNLISVNIDSSLLLAEQAIALSEDAGFTQGIAKGNNTAGVALMNQGNYGASFERYNKAIAAYRQIGDSSGTAQVYAMVGVCYGFQNLPAEALQWFLRSLKLRERLKDKPAIADLNIKIALVYDLSDDIEKAIEYAYQSLSQSQALGDKKGIMACYNNLGIFYGKKQDYNKALDVLQKATALATELQTTKVLGDIELNKGKVYAGLKQFPAAIQSLQTSLELYKKVHFPLGIARVYNALAGTYMSNGNAGAAQDAAKQSLEYAYTMHNTRLIYDNYEVMAQAAKKTGDYKRALVYTDSLLVLKDSIYSADKNELMARTRNNYELEKKETAIQLLEKENLAATSQRNMFIIIAACTLLVVCTTGWMYYQSRKKNKALAKRKAILQEMNTVRNKFISLLSHDIRTPLAGIISVIDLLTQHDLPDEERQKIWMQLRSSTGAALDTLDSMLFWARNQLKNTPAHKERVHLKQLAADILSLYQTISITKQVNIVDEITGDPVVEFDKDQLAFILRNLVANAVKFSYAGGSVVIGATQTTNGIELCVRDSGMGMSNEQVQKILAGTGDAFQKGTAGEQGSGIGLVMVKDFVEHNDAALQVESVKGQGSVFTIQIR